MKEQKELKQQIVKTLEGGDAHANFDAVISDVPAATRGARPAGVSHSLWEILEHLRIAQWDILEFSRNPKHVSPDFPSGYWPSSPEPPNAKAWDESIRQFRADHKAMCDLVASESSDLFARLPWGDGQTLLREALVLADHNAYHLGEFVLLRRTLGVWK